MSEERDYLEELEALEGPALDARLKRAQVRKFEAEAESLELDNEMSWAESENAFIYTFSSRVDRESVTACIDTLSSWERRDPRGEEPKTVIFNTNGGSVFDGLALFDYIKLMQERGHTVNTQALGAVFSMGSILMQCGTKRLMSRHSYMMIHEISSIGIGKVSELQDELKMLERLQERVLAILAERSVYSVKQIRNRWDRKDWWLDAAECVKLGFVDEISG